MTRRPLLVGNWKMNGLAESRAVLGAILDGADDLAEPELWVCPPATLLAGFAAAAEGRRVALGGQDCHPAPNGAHTGDISAEMLADAGARAVILGHSERRSAHGESDAEVAAKVAAAWRAGLAAILCVGETAEERAAGQAGARVAAQLHGSLPDALPEGVAARLVLAYEPVWAIGQGRTPTPEEIGEMAGRLRAEAAARIGGAAEGVRLLYGGSVSPGNAAEIAAVDGIDGALVGGASLKADSFLAIAAAMAR